MPDHELTPSPDNVSLDRDGFLRSLIRSLAGTLEDVVGLQEASGFISVVGQDLGAQINAEYRQAWGKTRFSREEVAEVLVDLKQRIQGQFHVMDQSDDRIILGNHACPFGAKVIGRPSMCMMTSNVFGSIAADHLGYAKVELAETIAEGHAGCSVVVHLRDTHAAREAQGLEYYAAASPD